MAHLGDDPPPPGVYTPAEAAIVRYARQSTLSLKIDDALYAELESHFTARQIVDIALTVGLSNLVNRFHATFLTDVDESVLEELGATTCPLPLPRVSTPR